MSIQVTLTLKEIHAALCPKCKEKLEQMIKEKVDQQVIKKTLE